MAGQPWTQAEIDYIRTEADSLTSSEIAEHLNRSRQMVQTKARQNGIKFYARAKSRRWSQEEITKLWGLAETHTIRGAASRLGRSYNSVANKVDELGISFKKNRLRLKDLGDIFGISSATIARRRDKLGLNFRTGKHNKRLSGKKTTRGPTGEDIVALAEDFLREPPGHNMTLTAKRLREIIAEYEGWE